MFVRILNTPFSQLLMKYLKDLFKLQSILLMDEEYNFCMDTIVKKFVAGINGATFGKFLLI